MRKLQPKVRKQTHKSATEISSLSVYLRYDIRKEEEEAIREIRDELKQEGRLDLARKYLYPLAQLKDLAGLFWRNEALAACSHQNHLFFGRFKPALAADFPEKRFTLIRSGEQITLERSDGKRAKIRLLWFDETFEEMRVAKIASNVAERLKAAQRRGAPSTPHAAAVKEVFIEIAPVFFSFEECACIFPDAALADDHNFIQRIVERYRNRRPFDPFEDRDVRTIGLYWHGFKLDGAAERILPPPPLKHWSDRAACEFVRFKEGNDKVSLGAYKERKKRARHHSERLTLVTGARYTREGGSHCLKCWR
jgi:hypothetical protein